MNGCDWLYLCDKNGVNFHWIKQSNVNKLRYIKGLEF